MTSRLYVRSVRKRWKLVLLFCALGLAASVIFTGLSKDQYQATAVIFVSTAAAGGDASQLAQGNAFTQARVQSYTGVATTPAVTDAVIDDLSLKISASDLASKISADAPLNKVLINIHVTDTDSAEAATLANSVADRFTTVIEQLERANAQTESPIKLTVIQPATPPAAPSSPNIQLNILLGLVIGIAIGLAFAIVRELTDTSVKTVGELAALAGCPALGAIPFDKRTHAGAIAIRQDAHGLRAEAFRQLRTNMQFVNVDKPPRIIAISSALPGEGKSHVAMNLAAAMAEAGMRVCLVEADLRKPTIARSLGLVTEVGLTTVLIGKAPVESVLQNNGSNFAVLTSGPVPPNPSELLVSDAFRSALEYVADRVDIVVVDTAPILPVADGVEVCALADVTLLTVRAGKTKRDQVTRAVGALDNVGIRPTGVVLSMVSTSSKVDSGYYYGGYRPSARLKDEEVRSVGEVSINSVKEFRAVDSADLP